MFALLILAAAQVTASVPAAGLHFTGQATRGVIQMVDRGGLRCDVRVPEVDSGGYATAPIRCSDGRTGLLKLRVDDEGIGIGYGSLEGHALSLTVMP